MAPKPAQKYAAPPATARGSLWWQNTTGAWFELRTNITPRYAEDDALQRIACGLKPLRFLPTGQKPEGTAFT